MVKFFGVSLIETSEALLVSGKMEIKCLIL